MIRRLKEEDISSVISLENETLNSSLGENILKDSITNPMAYFFVLEINKKIIGYISTMFDGEIVEILNFAINKENQHKGYGKELLIYIDNYFYSLKAKSMILEVRDKNVAAINIYNKFGFKKIHVRKSYYSNGDDAYILEHKLLNCEEVYDNYVLVDAKCIEDNDYYKFYDDIQKDKYYTNYFKLKKFDKDIIKELNNKRFRNFLMIWSEKEIDEYFETKFEKDSLVFMHSSIYGIKSLKNIDFNIIKLNDNNCDDLYEFEYQNCIEFGIDFAKGNAARAKSNLLNKKLDYFSYYKDNKIVANLFTYRINDAILIEDVFVEESSRHEGICSALFNFMINYHKNNGVKEVVLIADALDTPEAMYEKMGFTTCGKAFTYWME